METKTKSNIVRGANIILRPWLDTDAEVLYRLASDPDVGTRAGWAPHRSVEESLSVIRNVFRNDTTWAIVLPDSDGTPVGAIGYGPSCDCNLPALPDEPTVGYWVGKPFWNRGICTEALRTMIAQIREQNARCLAIRAARHIENHHPLQEQHFIPSLISGHYVDNPASGRVMEKCGFVPTGDICYDSALYGDPARPIRVLRLRL